MRYSFKNYFLDWWIFGPCIVSLVLEVFMVIYGIKHIRAVESGVFLRYSVLVGPSLHGSWWRLYGMPLLGFLMLLIHMIFWFFVYKQDRILARIMAFALVPLHIFLMVSFVLIIGINY